MTTSIERTTKGRFNIKQVQDEQIRRYLKNAILMAAYCKVLHMPAQNMNCLLRRHGPGKVGIFVIGKNVYKVKISMREKLIIRQCR